MTHPGEGIVNEVKLLPSGKPSHRQVCGEFWNLRRQHNWEKENKIQNMSLTVTASREVTQMLVSATTMWGFDREVWDA